MFRKRPCLEEALKKPVIIIRLFQAVPRDMLKGHVFDVGKMRVHMLHHFRHPGDAGLGDRRPDAGNHVVGKEDTNGFGHLVITAPALVRERALRVLHIRKDIKGQANMNIALLQPQDPAFAQQGSVRHDTDPVFLPVGQFTNLIDGPCQQFPRNGRLAASQKDKALSP